ncbi:fibronectin type III domain-containing protein [Actinomadura sediminis]|uniref:Fibronectin type III domain-containing protein n=1 Tax=Actinomadura sediminis TaxID=1038904 RepID=A0ABW3ESM2_9ACTN
MGAGAIFERDRLTGQLAVGLVGAVVIAAVVYGVGAASAKYELADVGAWLSARTKGLVVHVNGLAGKVDGKAPLPASARGDRIEVVQDGTTVLIVDRETGVVSRLDPSQMKIVGSGGFGPGIQVLAQDGRAYTVDSVNGGVQQLDAITLQPAGEPARLDPVLGQAGIGARGDLWVPVAVRGRLAGFRDGRLHEPVDVGEPGHDLALTIAAGTPVVVDSTAATATVVEPSGTRLTISLPSSVRAAGRGGVLAPAVADGTIVPLLVPGTGSLVTLDTGTGRHTSTRLQMPRHRYRAPQILGTRVYIPDETAGALIVYDAASKRFGKPVTVGRPKSPLEVFVKDGLLWANDPDGPGAVVVDRRGETKAVDKYREEVAGGERRREIPLPGTGGAPPVPGAPGRPGRDPVPPSSGNPREPGAPTAPSNLTVAPGDGTMQVTFQPSQGERITGYSLKDVPAGLTAAPAAIAPDAPPAFAVTGGDCGQEYRFRVAVQYTDARGRAKEVLSAASDPVRPCVTPGAPTDVEARAGASGTTVSWAAPAGGGATRYKVEWTGPVTGSKVVTGTSTTLTDVWTNGAYTFTVTSMNAAEAGSGTTIDTQLKGPDRAHKVILNGGSTAHIRATPTGAGAAEVTTMSDNNGDSITVHCQVKGTRINHPRDPKYSGNTYAKVTWKGNTGYMMNFLVDTYTSGNWDVLGGPPIWECAG